MAVHHEGFHAKDGWFFGRCDDGSVQIVAAVQRGTDTINLTAGEWASVLAAVCADGGTPEAYQAATRFHNNNFQPLGTWMYAEGIPQGDPRHPQYQPPHVCGSECIHNRVATSYTEQETTR